MKRDRYLFRRVLHRLNAAVGDMVAVAAFVAAGPRRLPLRRRAGLIRKLLAVTRGVECPHTEAEILACVRTILSLDAEGRPKVVEAGCFKGGSTAKFSLAAGIAGSELIVFDSFRGIPPHAEPHDKNIYGIPVTFDEGEYCGQLEEVRGNVAAYGDLSVCRFVEGWFEETLPGFREQVDAVYIDVDLASSVRTCVKYLYPLLKPGGSFFSHDGHLPLVVEALKDERFWREEVGFTKPRIEGLGRRKLVRIVKPADPAPAAGGVQCAYS